MTPDNASQNVLEALDALGAKARPRPWMDMTSPNAAYASVATKNLRPLVAALDAFLDSKTALRIACPTCTITLVHKTERRHEEDCPAWLAKEALDALQRDIEALA